MNRLAFFIAAIVVVMMQRVYTQIPHTLSYQGLLTDTDGVVREDDIYSFTFRFYTSESGGTPIWSETQSLSVQKGLFSAILGSVTPFGPGVTFDQQYWMSVEVAPDPELSPRIPLTAVGYSIRALNAEMAETVADNSISSSKIGDGHVVRSINHLRDNIIIQGAGGASVTTNGDTLTIAASGGGGSGIGALQNTDNTLDIINPTGPTATVNIKVPLILSGSTEDAVASVTNNFSVGGYAIRGVSSNTSGYGIRGENSSGSSSGGGVSGSAYASIGVYGNSQLGYGVYGIALSNNVVNYGVYGESLSPSGYGVFGKNRSGTGVRGESSSSTGYGVYGLNFSTTTGGTAIFGHSANGNGVHGQTASPTGRGVYGMSTAGSGWGVHGENNTNNSNARGVVGISNSGWGVTGLSTSGTGVRGESNGVAIRAVSHDGYALHSTTGTGIAVYGSTDGNPNGYAGYFIGRVHVTGTVSKSAGSFKIDHPLDPENMYLYHSFVESPDMMNIYNGNVTLDAGGEAWVQMPEWFEALNMDFRYLLTAIGTPGPNLFIAQKIENNRFKIAGGLTGMEVSWQVTGIRKDVYAEKYRVPVEEDKPAEERGKYLFPEFYGQSKEMGIHYTIVPPAELLNTFGSDVEQKY
jgi:hypothetical protein